MFFPGWSAWCILLTLHITSAGGLETVGYDGHEVICSQGLSRCTMKDEIPLLAENMVDVQKLEPHFKLCCTGESTCALCLVIDTELHIHEDKDRENEGHSGSDEEEYSEETRNQEASVTVCYSTAATMPTCKKVEFTVNHADLTHQNQVKMSMVITEPDGFPFSSQVFVYPAKQGDPYREVVAPSLNEVCSQDLQKHIPKCHVPTVSSVINQEMNQVELQFEGRNDSTAPMCVQYEENGKCQTWNMMTIPLYAVTPCMCLQVWDEDNHGRRLQLCPFKKKDFLQKNIWDNVSVSLQYGKMNDYGTMLSWNVSAPCRLEGEIWPCHRESSCWEISDFRQQLTNGTWKQNSKGHWANTGVFENIDLQLLPCVMVKIKGMGHELGPFCPSNTSRGHWTLLAVGVMLLVCLTAILFYFLHDFIKKWVWSCHHGGFVKIGRKGHVLVLSPPDADDGVSESVGQLGSFLCSQGFSVSVDQWSRKEQCTLGPLPWLHSQLLKINSLGGRVLLVLTHKALERAEEWTQWTKDMTKVKEEDKDPRHLWSPYADTFTASLFLIQMDKQLGRAGFLLVKFDTHPTQSHRSDKSLPELLQGLPLFQLPSQTQSLLTELTVAEAERGLGRRTWIGQKWGRSLGWRAKTKEGQKALSCKYLGVGKNVEIMPANHP